MLIKERFKNVPDKGFTIETDAEHVKSSGVWKSRTGKIFVFEGAVRVKIAKRDICFVLFYSDADPTHSGCCLKICRSTDINSPQSPLSLTVPCP